MAGLVSRKKLLEFQVLFDSYSDFDSDGHITVQDLKEVMSLMDDAPSKDQIKQMIKNSHANTNEPVKFPEFLKFMLEVTGYGGSDEEIKVVFDYFDKGEEGFITTDELEDLMTSIGKKSNQEVDKMIRKWRNGNGEITCDEFVKMMKLCN